MFRFLVTLQDFISGRASARVLPSRKRFKVGIEISRRLFHGILTVKLKVTVGVMVGVQCSVRVGVRVSDSAKSELGVECGSGLR